MDSTRKLIEALREFRKVKDDFYYATVTKVDGRTCSIKITDLELSLVRLRATTAQGDDELLITPKIGSMVIVGSNHGALEDLVVLKVDDPEKIFYKHGDITVDINGVTGKIVINEGKNGGLVIVGKVAEKLNKLEDDINSLKQVFLTWVPVPNDGGQALKSAATNWMKDTLERTNKSDIENDKVKH